MITLPPGFNYTALINDLFTASLPFIGVGVVIVSFIIIMKAMRHF